MMESESVEITIIGLIEDASLIEDAPNLQP